MNSELVVFNFLKSYLLKKYMLLGFEICKLILSRNTQKIHIYIYIIISYFKMEITFELIFESTGIRIDFLCLNLATVFNNTLLYIP